MENKNKICVKFKLIKRRKVLKINKTEFIYLFFMHKPMVFDGPFIMFEFLIETVAILR